MRRRRLRGLYGLRGGVGGRAPVAAGEQCERDCRATTAAAGLMSRARHAALLASRSSLHARGGQPGGDPGEHLIDDLPSRLYGEDPPARVGHRAREEGEPRRVRRHGAASRVRVRHLVPLELGGAVNDPRNLWPEPGASPNPKDALEDRLRSMVCDGELTLAAARAAIATNWVSAYRRVVR